MSPTERINKIRLCLTLLPFCVHGPNWSRTALLRLKAEMALLELVPSPEYRQGPEIVDQLLEALAEAEDDLATQETLDAHDRVHRNG